MRQLVSRATWKLWPQSGIGLEDIRIADDKYLVTSDGSRLRCMALYRVGVPDLANDPRIDYSAALKTTLQQQRMRGLFEGLRRAAVPFVYLMLMSESEGGDAENSVLEFDLIIGTWADLKKKDDGAEAVERRASILSATVSVALPTASVVRLARRELSDFARSVLLPGRRPLPQAASASITGALCTFDEMSPLVAMAAQAPDFYVPNATESGKEGILLGTVMSGGREYHDFRLQLEDLKRHVCVLGMTGSGKSTTARTIVKQVSELGLPALILDWHNEYGGMVAALGGRVLAPGRDEFSLNPLEPIPGADPVEHIAMVSDIFSDIYHFTHPQAYMFRNALQKLFSESASEEVSTILTLVKTIEAYPLRSAYDNETKVALLRRLVPLTQGQPGRALGGSGAARLDELLSISVCVELGHMRDVQSRGIFADVLLKMIYEEKVKRKGAMDHLTVIEEARNIAPARRIEDSPTVGERMISELRKFGEAMMFVAQFPTQVAAEVLKNTGTKLVHRLAWPDDIALVGDSLSLSPKQREHLTRLRVGEVVVGLGRIQKPMLVQVRADYSPGVRRNLSLAAES